MGEDTEARDEPVASVWKDHRRIFHALAAITGLEMQVADTGEANMTNEHTNHTRRDFIKTAATGVAVAIVPNALAGSAGDTKPITETKLRASLKMPPRAAFG